MEWCFVKHSGKFTFLSKEFRVEPEVIQTWCLSRSRDVIRYNEEEEEEEEEEAFRSWY
jgi:hypothetical protein